MGSTHVPVTDKGRSDDLVRPHDVLISSIGVGLWDDHLCAYSLAYHRQLLQDARCCLAEAARRAGVARKVLRDRLQRLGLYPTDPDVLRRMQSRPIAAVVVLREYLAAGGVEPWAERAAQRSSAEVDRG
ncbi:MAG: hypothetical protein KC501_27950 [Myxococcales bacterium]|nr:hypothetical protein [Myxococcales bacterium]